MSGMFRHPHQDWPCFQSILNLSLAAWLAIASCQPLESASLKTEEMAAHFQLYLENQQFDQAEQLLNQFQGKLPQEWQVQASLQLAHGLNQIGCPERGLQILDQYWSKIVASPMQAFGLMLRARLKCGRDDQSAWADFCQAEKLLEIQDWPAEDARAFAFLSDRMEEAFRKKKEIADRLRTGPMKREAIAAYQWLIETLAQDEVPSCRLQTLDGFYLLRELLLQVAHLQLELSEATCALQTIEHWPELTHENTLPRFVHQEMQRLLLKAQAYLQLNDFDHALTDARLAMQLGDYHGKNPNLLLQATLIASQTLSHLHQLPQALELLDHAQKLICRCAKDEQTQAQILWIEQRCRLLCQMGRVHQAIEELDSQISLLPLNAGRSQLLSFKAKLYEQIGQISQAQDAYMNLLETGCDPSQSSSAVAFLLNHVEKSGWNDPINIRLRNYILRKDKPILDPQSMIALSEWAIRNHLATRSELTALLGTWLRAIQDGQHEPQALYLLACLEGTSSESIASIQKALSKIESKSPVHLLFQGLLIQRGASSASQAVEQLCELADIAYSRSFKAASDQIYSWACEIALASPSTELWQKAYELSRARFDRVKNYDQWTSAYIELCFRLNRNCHSLPLEACQLASQMQKRPTYWGLRCTLSHAQALLQVGMVDQALDCLNQWNNQSNLPELLQRQALVEAADLLHRAARSKQARPLIDSILEKWPDLPERPWLELRRYTLEEYDQKIAGSQDNLHSIILRYREHPAALCAYYLRARQASAFLPANEQLKLWEDVERKAQELSRNQTLEADAQAMVASASLQRARCLEAMGLKAQAIGCLRSLLAQPSTVFYSACAYCLLEQQARFELAKLLFDTSNDNQALEQLQLLLKDPYPSQWQAKAQIELANFDLRNHRPQDCLNRLRELSAHTKELQAQRLLLAARSWQQLGQLERAYAHICELMNLSESEEGVREIQLQGLWDLYQYLNVNDPKRAQTTLLQLSRYEHHPLADKAKRLLQSSPVERHP